MMNRITLTYTEKEIAQAARTLMEAVGRTGRRVVALHAGMGAGKTTLVAALCKALHTAQEASSPTFALINEYSCGEVTGGITEPKSSIYHFDFYRIEHLEEALDLGIYDYFDSGALCLIEWPERIEALLPPDTLWVKIDCNADQTRTLSIYID